MIQHYKIDKRLLDTAKDKAVDLGILNNSIAEGEGSVAGFIGEQLAALALDANIVNTYNYDLVLPDGATIDVKTKRVSSVPRETYSCSVANFNTKQKCDFYAFTRVLLDLTEGWYLGKVDKETFYKKATFHKKGEYDPTNNFVFAADCYNLPIKELENG